MAENNATGLQDISRGNPIYDSQKRSIEEDQKKKEFEKVKTKLDELAKFISKKYKFVEAIGLIPQNFNQKIEADEAIPEEECKKGLMHVAIIVQDDKEKEIPKIQLELINHLKDKKEKIWLHIMSRLMFWELGLDSRFDFAAAVSMSYPLLDKVNFLSGIRVAQIHKELVLQKFGKFITSYIMAGSMVTGTATKTSDIDSAIIIDDTDVKRMSRVELRERLRSQIYQLAFEAAKYAGVPDNMLNVQVWLLTEFWEGVKDATPVFFTYIRDGIPIYDRGSFLPWKLLLKMGKIKPSPEAIDLFMSSGENLEKKVDKYLLDIVIIDLYWGVITPTQALFMLYGETIPIPKYLISETEKLFVKKEKLLEKKYTEILKRIVSIYKDYEHAKIKSVKGVEIDKLKTDAVAYIKRLKELRVQLEKRRDENIVNGIYDDTFKLLKNIFGAKSSTQLVTEFKKELVKKGIVHPSLGKTIDDLVLFKQKFKQKKPAPHETERVRKASTQLINSLIEYSQRCDLSILEKNSMRLKYMEQGKEKIAEMLILDQEVFLVKDGVPVKVTDKGLNKVSQSEFESALSKQKDKKTGSFNPKVLHVIEKVIGDFEVIL